MNKSRLLLFLILFTAVCASEDIWAEQVSEAKARSVASQFMIERGMGAVATAQPTRIMRLNAATQQDAAYYVFNAQKDKGFVVVSGDDRTEPVLGYSNKGNFDPNDVPENMQAWLDQYAEEISMLDAFVIDVHTKANPTDVIQPFLKSQWSQEDPFDLQSPKYNGDYCKTGCVATAMAQVMYYYKWPLSTSKAIPGYTQKNNNLAGTTYPALPVTTFDWSVMKDYYEDSYYWPNDPDKAAVAKLMHYCGQAVRMNYGVGSSGARGFSEVFEEYFNYSTKARRMYRSDYSWSQWQNFIIAELKAKRPVLYMGEDKRVGHAFVIDGYDGHGYYHVNWGWRGIDDGYFLLSSLNPIRGNVNDNIGYNGYMLYNEMIIGLEPNTASTNEKNSVVTCDNVDVEKQTYTRGSSSEAFSIRVKGIFRNESIITKTYRISWAVYKSDGFTDYQYYNNSEEYTLGYNEKTDTLTRYLNFGKNFENGTYYLRPICLEKGGSQWHLIHDSGNFYIKAVVSGNTLTLTPITHYIGTVGNNTATIVSYSDIRKVNRPLHVKVKASKSNLVSDYIQIYLFDNDQLVGANTVNFDSGSSQYITIDYTPKEAGTRSLKLTSNNAGNIVYSTGSVYIENGAPGDLTMNYNPVNTNSNNVTYDNYLTFYGHITNNLSTTYNDYIVAVLFKDKPTTHFCDEKMVVCNLAPSATTSGYFTFSRLEPGKYNAYFKYYNGNTLESSMGTDYFYVLVKGDVNCDGLVTAADITALYDNLLNGVNLDIKYADQNGDGLITAADITAVYDVLLGN